MLARALCGAVFGLEGVRVDVEANIAEGLPGFHIVGLGDRALQEARERVKIAVNNSGFEFPGRKVTVNLAPAQLPKLGSGFDLAMAAAIVSAAMERNLPADAAWLGELALDGRVRPVRGVRHFFVPRANLFEARLATNHSIVPVMHLGELIDHWKHGAPLPEAGSCDPVTTRSQPDPVDLAEVCGQPHARRALEIAAAGGHHLLMMGPPGAGKTLLARAMPGLLPPLTEEEALEVTTIASCLGLLPAGGGLLSVPPFRAPHHSISPAGLVGGGGAVPLAGEVTRAHRGILFLDEFAEFRRDALEALRQPLEEGRLAVARARGHAVLPARFILVAAANPCACGFAGDPGRSCECTPPARARYRERISGPIRDRIDLQVRVSRQPAGELLGQVGYGEPSRAVRERVQQARARQQERRPHGPLNGSLTGPMLRRDAPLPSGARDLLENAAERLRLSGRAIHRVLRVARTIADLEGAPALELPHVAEALQYRESG
jgi:magnesium chelatase family protein